MYGFHHARVNGVWCWLVAPSGWFLYYRSKHGLHVSGIHCAPLEEALSDPESWRDGTEAAEDSGLIKVRIFGMPEIGFRYPELFQCTFATVKEADDGLREIARAMAAGERPELFVALEPAEPQHNSAPVDQEVQACAT